MPSLIWRREYIQFKRGVKSIMVGRPRKAGRRQPNGQLARGYVDPKAQVMAQPHRVLVPERFRAMPEAESEFGRLMLRGIITPAQHEAGRRYAMLAARYRAAKGYPPIHPVAINLVQGGGGFGVDAPDHVIRAAVRAYDDAFVACYPHKVQRAVTHHAVFERKISDLESLRLMKIGLDNLVGHFHINPEMALDRDSRSSVTRI